MNKSDLNETDFKKQNTEIDIYTPQSRGRKESDVPNSDFDLMNVQLLEMGSLKSDHDSNIDKVGKDTIFQNIKFVQKFASYFQFFSEFILRDFKNKPLNNIISVSTIVLLIIFLGLINSMMSLSPMIYLMMSEQEAGESDILFINSNLIKGELQKIDIKNTFLDYKSINDQYCNVFLKGCTSRFQIKGMSTINNQDFYSDVFLIDVMKEEEIGLGRRFQLSELKDNECYISKNLYINLKKSGEIKDNQKPKIVVDFTLASVLNSIPILQSENQNVSQDKIYFVANILYRKFEEDGVYYNNVKDLILHYLPNTYLNSVLKNFLDSFDFDGYFGIQSSEFNSMSINQRQYEICRSLAGFALNLKISFKLEVKDFIENSVGKFEEKYSNVIILDYKTQMNMMMEQIANSTVSEFIETIQDKSLTHYITLLVIKSEITTQLLDNIKLNVNSTFIENNAISIYGIYDNKQNVYLEDSNIINELRVKSNKFTDTFGSSHTVSLLFPLSFAQIQNLKQKQMLDNSYNSGVILLIALSSVIIYSVSQSTIQQKVQEFGVIRIIGYSTRSLVFFSFAKAVIFYMVPALALAQLLNIVIQYFIKSYFYNLLKFSSDLSQNYSSTYYATTIILGVCLPLFCNLYPFKEFFEKQVLSQSINVHQRVLKQSKIIAQKLEKYGISFYALINSIILIVFGILTYYFAPYAFVSKKIGMFLFIVNLTFLLFNVGISFLLNLVQRKMELAWIKLCLCSIFKQDRNLETSINNNFKNNHLRMQKLGMIIMMIFSFYISIGSSVNTQIMMAKNVIKQNIGSDYMLETQNPNEALDEYKLTQNLENFKKIYPDTIKAYSFVSKSITTIHGFEKGAKIKNFIGQSSKVDLYGIGPDFYDSVYNELFIPELLNFEDQNPSNSLYFNNRTSIGRYTEDDEMINRNNKQVFTRVVEDSIINQIKVIEHDRKQTILFYTSAQNKKQLSINYKTLHEFVLGDSTFKGIAGGFAKKVPGYKSFTENPIFSLFQNSVAFVSFEQMSYMMSYTWRIQGCHQKCQKKIQKRYPENSTFDIPKDRLFIKINDDVKLTSYQRSTLKSYLIEDKGDFSSEQSNQQQQQQSIKFYESYPMLASLDYLISFWSLLFNLISIFIFILSYYLLTITFKQNISENLHNIKIYKSIGLSHQQIKKIFVYEGVGVMFVNGVTGYAVGLILSIMVQQQLIVLLEMPMDITQIPFGISTILLIMCIGLSVFSSRHEIDKIKDLQIAQLDK